MQFCATPDIIVRPMPAIRKQPWPAPWVCRWLGPAYTAAFLGAAVLAKKKRFDLFGSVFSVFVLLALSNGLSLMNQPRWIASAISGLVLLIAVLLNRPQNRKV